ncbi:MAG: septum formation initiator family protein [Desulfovibrionales bacterium]|nr:septum formation initiator family protein [Desulfovibrionales bacterium]
MLFKRISLAVSVALNVLLIGYLFVNESGFQNYQVLKADLAGLSEHQITLDERAYVLSQEIRLLQNDSDYIEKVIRKRLGFVKKNEILYLFPDDTTSTISGAHE